MIASTNSFPSMISAKSVVQLAVTFHSGEQTGRRDKVGNRTTSDSDGSRPPPLLLLLFLFFLLFFFFLFLLGQNGHVDAAVRLEPGQ